MATTARRYIEIEIDASKAVRQLGAIEKNTKGAEKQMTALRKRTDQFATVLKGVVVYQLARLAGGLVDFIDQAIDLQAKLSGVTKNTVGFTTAFEDLYEVAQKTGTATEALSSSYVKLAVALPTAEHKDLVGILDVLATNLATTGASTQQVNAVMLQFAQAMGSAALQGDEFRSVFENAPGIIVAWRKALGKTDVAFKDLSANADLTAESFIELYDEIGRISEEMVGVEKPADTAARGLQRLKNAFQRLVIAMEADTGLFSIFADALNLVAAGAGELAVQWGMLAGNRTLAVVTREYGDALSNVAFAQKELENAQDNTSLSQRRYTNNVEFHQRALDDARQKALDLTEELDKLRASTAKASAEMDAAKAELAAMGEAAELTKQQVSGLTRELERLSETQVGGAIDITGIEQGTAALKRGGEAALAYTEDQNKAVKEFIRFQTAFNNVKEDLPPVAAAILAKQAFDVSQGESAAERAQQEELKRQRDLARSARTSGGGGGGGTRTRSSSGGGAERDAERLARQLEQLRDIYVGLKEAADPLLEIQNRHVDVMVKLSEAMKLGAISQTEYGEAVKLSIDATDQAVQEYLESIEKASIQTALFDAVASDIENAFTGLATGTVTWAGALENLTRSLANAITQLLVIAPLMAGIKGLLPGGDGFFEGLAGAFSATGTSLPGRANGGPVAPNHAYMVGERGPEVFVPNSSGQIASGINVTVNTLPGTSAEVREDQGGLTIDIVDMHVAASFAAGGNMISQAAETAYPGLRRGLG